MDQLSSCYFCGAALNASLEAYPVVPESYRSDADDRQTVVLCGNCKPKLDAVVETIAGAVEAGSGGADRSGQSGDRPSDSSRSKSDLSESGRSESGRPEPGGSESHSGESDVESTLGDDADVLQPVGDDGDTEGSSRGSADGAPSAGASNGSGSDARDDRPKYTSSRRAGHDRTSADPDPGDDETGEAADGADTDGDPPRTDPTLTRLENTNVMRLLQNREFPVDRDDFVIVASSAYEISHSDCEKVIDLAVEHDLLDERNGQIYAGDRWE